MINQVKELILGNDHYIYMKQVAWITNFIQKCVMEAFSEHDSRLWAVVRKEIL